MLLKQKENGTPFTHKHKKRFLFTISHAYTITTTIEISAVKNPKI